MKVTITMEKNVEPMSSNSEKVVGLVHSQVLRIREEDSHLGEDIYQGFNTKDRMNEKVAMKKVKGIRKVGDSGLDVVFLTRPVLVLPCSPLAGKHTVKEKEFRPRK